MGSFSSAKSTSTSGPASYTAPYVQNALQTAQDQATQQQPALNAYGTIAGAGGAAMAPGAFQTSPYVSNAQGAARAISNGAFLGANPGQSTYDQLQGAGTPASTGLLTNPAPTPTPGSAALTALTKPGANPGDAFASKVAQGEYLNNQPSSGLYSDIMSSDYLKGNPYLDNIIAQTNGDVETQAARQFAQRGMGAGISSPYMDVLSKNLANNESNLRYQNYNDAANRQLTAAGQSDAAFGAERGRMDSATGLLSSDYNNGQDRALAAAQTLNNNALQAAQASDTQQNNQVAQMLQALGLTGQLSDAQYAGVAPTIQALTAGGTIPLLGTDALQTAIANLTGATNTSTSKTSGPGLGASLLASAASGAGAALASDRRLKTNIEKVGELDDGLGVYDFDYIDPAFGQGRQRGVMADEVAKLRPWALGPKLGGEYSTVCYGRL